MVQHLMDGELVDARVVQRNGGHRVAGRIEGQARDSDDLTDLLQPLVEHVIE